MILSESLVSPSLSIREDHRQRLEPRFSPSALHNWAQKLATIAPRCEGAFGTAPAYRRWCEQFLAHLQAPETFTYSTLIVVRGIRPEQTA